MIGTVFTSVTTAGASFTKIALRLSDKIRTTLVLVKRIAASIDNNYDQAIYRTYRLPRLPIRAERDKKIIAVSLITISRKITRAQSSKRDTELSTL